MDDFGNVLAMDVAGRGEAGKGARDLRMLV